MDMLQVILHGYITSHITYITSHITRIHYILYYTGILQLTLYGYITSYKNTKKRGSNMTSACNINTSKGIHMKASIIYTRRCHIYPFHTNHLCRFACIITEALHKELWYASMSFCYSWTLWRVFRYYNHSEKNPFCACSQ